MDTQSCGQQPSVGGPASGTMKTDEPGPNNPFPLDPKNGGYHRPSPCGEYEEVEEGAGCPCCGDGPCNCGSDCAGCDCANMEEAIGDGFLSQATKLLAEYYVRCLSLRRW